MDKDSSFGEGEFSYQEKRAGTFLSSPTGEKKRRLGKKPNLTQINSPSDKHCSAPALFSINTKKLISLPEGKKKIWLLARVFLLCS